MPDAPGPQAGYLELVRSNTQFRRLWLGNIVSHLGDWFNTIALYSLIVELTGSPLALGAVFIAKMLPWAIVSPLAGLIADRLNRRRLMIASDLLRAVVVLGFLVVDEPGEVPLLFALTALQVVMGSVFLPAHNASIPNVTTPRELLTANALMSATWSTMLAVGAALGGLAAEAFGYRVVFLIDSASYVVSAWFIYRTAIPQRTDAPARGPLVATAVREVLDGWRHLRTHPSIQRIALVKSTWAVFGGGLVYMLALLGDRVAPGAVAAGIGVLFMARGIGTGIGPIVARNVFKDRRQWVAMMGGCIVFSGLCYEAIGFVGWSPALVVVIIILVMLAHSTSGANWVLATVLLQERTEDRFRGRVFATEWLLVMLADTLSILTASLLLEQGILDLRMGVRVFAAGQVLMGVLWLVVIVPRERRALSMVNSSIRQ
jgi:MFS family permease